MERASPSLQATHRSRGTTRSLSGGFFALLWAGIIVGFIGHNLRRKGSYMSHEADGPIVIVRPAPKPGPVIVIPGPSGPVEKPVPGPKPPGPVINKPGPKGPDIPFPPEHDDVPENEAPKPEKPDKPVQWPPKKN